MRHILILLFVLGLAACSAPTPAVPPEQHHQWAMELLQINDVEGATKELKLVLQGRKDMTDALLYADLLETKKKYRAALSAYRRARSFPAPPEQLQQLDYRLALLELDYLNNDNRARRLVNDLPTVDARRYDLKGLLLLRKGDLKQASIEIERGLQLVKEREIKGWLYLHRAMLYAQKKIERETFGSLFNAINNARGHNLVARLTEYWDKMRFETFPNH